MGKAGSLALGFCAVLLWGCGDSNNGGADANGDGTESVSAVVGSDGGSIELSDGAGVDIPPGALDEPTTITVSVTVGGFAPLPAVASGRVYAFEPHGQTFLLPVTVTIPHQGQPEEMALFTSSLGGDWAKISSDKGATALSAAVTHFSFFFNGREVCGLYRQECCLPEDGAECAGDALDCVDGRCLECGLEGDPCCGGLGGTCLGAGNVCLDGYCSGPGPDAGPPVDAVPMPDAPALAADAGV